jgi:hypothetical protein
MLAQISASHRRDCKAFSEKRVDHCFDGAIEAVIHD